MGKHKAIAGLAPRGNGDVAATPPSLPPPPALGHHSSGAYGHSPAGPPAGGSGSPSILHACTGHKVAARAAVGG